RQAGLALATAVCDSSPAHQSPRDHADREEDDPGVDPEAGYTVGLVRRGGAVFYEAREESVKLGGRTSRQSHSCRDSHRNGDPTKAAFRGHDAPFKMTDKAYSSLGQPHT